MKFRENQGKIYGSNSFSKNQNRDPTWPDFLDFEEFDLKNLKISLFEGTFLTKLYVGLYL